MKIRILLLSAISAGCLFGAEAVEAKKPKRQSKFGPAQIVGGEDHPAEAEIVEIPLGPEAYRFPTRRQLPRSLTDNYMRAKILRMDLRSETLLELHFEGVPLDEELSGSAYVRVLDSLRRKHGDTVSNRQIPPVDPVVNFYYGMWWEERPMYYLADDFVRLDVVSDADWDAEHPAGAPLNDLAVFESCTPYDYIAGRRDIRQRNVAGVDSLRYLQPSDYDLYVKTYYRKPVSDLQPDDLVLLGGKSNGFCGFLEFVSLPALESAHRITVIMETDEGRIFTASKTMRFPVRAAEQPAGESGKRDEKMSD